jgi:hypothetical protein
MACVSVGWRICALLVSILVYSEMPQRARREAGCGQAEIDFPMQKVNWTCLRQCLCDFSHNDTFVGGHKCGHVLCLLP